MDGPHQSGLDRNPSLRLSSRPLPPAQHGEFGQILSNQGKCPGFCSVGQLWGLGLRDDFFWVKLREPEAGPLCCALWFGQDILQEFSSLLSLEVTKGQRHWQALGASFTVRPLEQLCRTECSCVLTPSSWGCRVPAQ